jgi:DNA ligase-1
MDNTLAVGETVEVQGSASKPYIVKNEGAGAWYCTCPAWRNCPGSREFKTCKHIKKVQASCKACPAPQAALPLVTEKVITADKGYAQDILNRAASEGRKLRQDEKAKLHGPPVLLAHTFEDADVDPAGWWCSEKLDGVRAYWDGTNFISRQGNLFHAPDWFKAALPKDAILDGELWMGREMFQQTLSVVKRFDWGAGARDIKYVIFDVPSLTNEPFEVRQNAVTRHVAAANRSHVVAHPHYLVRSREHLFAELAKIEAVGGEGLMIRKPESMYEVGRSNTLLKVKPFKDDEGVVLAHIPGKGKNKGTLGSVTVRWNGLEFEIGTGFSDAERRSPPPVGCTVTFRYTGLTCVGKPKCTSFVAIRDGY